MDQANNDSYSRLTDGDDSTFWKSNPYLDPHYTRESDSDDPQWIMFEYPGGPVSVDTLKVSWAEPHTKSIKVQYWVGEGRAVYPSAPDGRWVSFPTSVFSGKGGNRRLTWRGRPSMSNTCACS